MILDIHQFLSLRENLPVVDVRSEGEYQQGHIEGAINIPLLNNEERVAVGIDYKTKGQAEAIKTGFRLVGPRLYDIVLDAEKLGKEFLVHCWRGGMRSFNFCQLMSMGKIKTYQLLGGYKAYRQLAQHLFQQPIQFIVLGGCTGSGKSEMLAILKAKGEQVIDLETLAHHKGSAFGGLKMPPQPTTEQFQNYLFEALLRLDVSKRIWIEDESIGVGKVFIPIDLWKRMGSSPVIEVELEKSKRVERLVREYGDADPQQFLDAMEKITRKLGGQNFIAAKEKLLKGDLAGTIELLLTYYDKAYLRGLERKKDRIKLTASWNGFDMNGFVEQLIKSYELRATSASVTTS